MVPSSGNVDLRLAVPVIWLYSPAPLPLLSRLIEAVPAVRGAVAIEYIFGNDRAAAVYARRGFVEVRRDPADQPGWPDQVWAELTLPATSTPA